MHHEPDHRLRGGCALKCTTNSTTGSDSGPPGALLVNSGPKSLCEGFAAAIGAKVEAGLSAQRIYQDLVGESTFKGSYQSVRRFVARLKASEPRRVWRMELAKATLPKPSASKPSSGLPRALPLRVRPGARIIRRRKPNAEKAA